MSGGLLYFNLQKDGQVVPPDKVASMSKKSQDVLHAAVYNHFLINKPSTITHFQVELNDYGLLIDYTLSGPAQPLVIPSLSISLANKTYTIVF